MKKSILRATVVLIGSSLATVGLTGCHSHYVAAQVKNDSGAPISLVELDYPSASFGKESLAGGAVYPYRFKILGDGPTKVLWTDIHHRDHSATGPSLHEGQEGTLTVTITGAGATWETKLR